MLTIKIIFTILMCLNFVVSIIDEKRSLFHLITFIIFVYIIIHHGFF